MNTNSGGFDSASPAAQSGGDVVVGWSDDIVRFATPVVGPFVIEASYDGADAFCVTTLGADGEDLDLAVNTFGSYRGRVLCPGDDPVAMLRIEGVGSWRIRLLDVHECPHWDGRSPIAGTSDEVLFVPGNVTEFTTVVFTGRSDGPVELTARSADDAELLVCDFGDYVGRVGLRSGVTVVAVRSAGTWSLTVDAAAAVAVPAAVAQLDTAAASPAVATATSGTIWRRSGESPTFGPHTSGDEFHFGSSGRRLVDLRTPLADRFVVEMMHAGSGHFTVAAVGFKNGTVGLLADVTGAWTGRAICDLDVAVRELEVEADGAWTARVLRYDDRWDGPGAVSGTSDDIVEFTTPAAGPFIVEVEHDGDGRISVDAISVAGELVAELAEFVGPGLWRAVCFEDTTVAMLQVRAQGPWRVSVNEHFRIWNGRRPLSGTGDATVLVRDGLSKFTPVTFTHLGAGAVDLSTLSPAGLDCLVDTEGAYSGTVGAAPGTTTLFVWADGAWSIEPR